MKKITLLTLGIFCLFTLNSQASDHALSSSQIIRLLQSNPAQFGLGSEDVSEARISDMYKDKKMGLTHVYVQQIMDSLPILNGILSMHLNSKGNVLHYSSNMVAKASSHIEPADLPSLTEAVMTASQNTKLIADATAFVKINPAFEKVVFTEQDKFYYPCLYFDGEKLHKSLNLVFFELETSNWYNYIVGANGAVLDVINWTNHCAFSSAKAAKTGDDAVYNTLFFPTESPLYGNRKYVKNAHDSVASPFGWLDVDGVDGPEFTITKGNNTWASEDADADNIPGYSPDGGNSLVFDFNYDSTSLDPTEYRDYAIANLFVANNLMHDILYHYGFDEASGNFQSNNYNRGGDQFDEVIADAQDGSGTDNANFATPPDGSNPRMQMYIWNATSGANGPMLRVNSPETLKFRVGSAQFGTALTPTPITANLVYVNDGTAAGTKGCNALQNGSALKGKIAAVLRGNCTFVEKVLNAQKAGAIAVVILDTSSANALVTMSGTSSQITIPSVFAKLSDAGALQEFLAGGAVNISLYDSAGFTPKTDSDLDLGVIAHEFGHGVSNRLTCGPSVSSGLNNAEQMGEGWSDFLSLALTVRSGQVGTTKRGIGNWLVGEDASGGGIRTYPYSTNMAVNPHTYNNIKTQSVNGKTGVHYVGEVWCVMLWDLHWKMVEKYGYSNDLIYGSAGNNKAIELVMAGMKLQKCNPGFVDGRDAILQADTLLNGGANGDLIWSVFARRGLGLSASQGSSNSTSDGTQAFDVPTSTAGTQTLNKAIAIAYPIPTSDELVVEATSVKTLETITVTDASGRKAQVSVKSRTEDACILDVRSLTPGIYFIQVTSSNQKEILRFQKI